MFAFSRVLKTVLLSIAAASALSACIVVPGPPRVVYRDAPSAPPPQQGQAPQQYPQDVVVDVPPPAPQYEVIPVVPFLGAIWIGGHWGWYGGRHNWIGGYYARPQYGYRYVPRRWEPHGGGRWSLRGGYWGR
jgi:hypothetical protein